MSRKAEKFFDAITLLREDLVEEAQNHVFRKKRNGWRTFGSLAACLMLVVSLGLLALPKGCGGAAPPMMNSSSDFCAPEEMPGDANTDGVHGDSPAGGLDAAPAPEPSGEAPPDAGMGGPARFNAQVLEILEDELLAELLPEEGLLMGASRVHIPTAGLDGLPALQPGDVIAVSCETFFLVNGEAVAEAAGTEVRLAEPDGR